MRRLVLLASSIVFVETVFFSALAPLLPYYEERFGLSKEAAGVLTAIYAAGAIAGSVPAGAFAARVGAKVASIVGLAIMVGASVAFGFADSVAGLDAARACQGVGSAVAWTGALAWLIAQTSRERRGEAIGFAMGAAVAGALLGPVVGWAATEVGSGAAFSAVGVVGVALAGWALVSEYTPPSERQALRDVRPALREPRVLHGFWLVSLAAILLGVISVLGPLRLDDLGWDAFWISVCFLASAGVGAVLSPVQGRWSDRRGPSAPVRIGLVGSIACSVALVLVDERFAFLVLVFLAAVLYGFFWVPGTAILSDGTERAGLDLVFGAMLLNLAWAPGDVVGAAVGGALGSALGDDAVYLLIVALCAVTLLVAGRLAPARPLHSRGATGAASPASSAPAE